MNRVGLPEDRKIAGLIVSAEAEHTAQKIKRGIMGTIFGMGLEKPANVAGFAMIVSAIMILVLLFATLGPDIPRREMLTLFAGVFTSALGYVFGNASKGGSA